MACIENISNLTNNFTKPINALHLCDCEHVQKLIKPELVTWDIPLRLHWLYVLTMMLSLAIMFTNLPIIIGIVRDKQMHKMHNIFIAGQAFSDFSLGFVLSIFFVGSTITRRIPGEQTGCNIYGYWIPLSCHSTVFSLALIAHGRHKAIVKNEKYSVIQCLKLILGVVWLPSFALTAIYTSVSEATLACSGYYCNPIWNEKLMPICGFFLLAPTIYIFWAYKMIHRKVIETSQAVDKVSSITKQRQVDRQQAQNHMTRLMIVMCLSIFIAWIPMYIYFIARIVDLSSNDVIQTSSISAIEYGVGLGATLSSLVSPILYVFHTDNLRLAMMYALLPLSWKKTRVELENKRKREIARLKAEKDQQDQKKEGLASGNGHNNNKNYGKQEPTTRRGIFSIFRIGRANGNIDTSSTESSMSNDHDRNGHELRNTIFSNGKKFMLNMKTTMSSRLQSDPSPTNQARQQEATMLATIVIADAINKQQASNV